MNLRSQRKSVLLWRELNAEGAKTQSFFQAQFKKSKIQGSSI
ncbi:MAG: hypothetical protein ACI85O_000519 [Saprospiraceae bacterium]|jgi:hypothetical protein